jgi:ABC-2 type transport system ATP-binding protein
MAAALEIEAVTKRYRRAGPWVLDEVTLTVPPGHAVQVVGANGSGKSTLLRVASGLARPSGGTVRRGGAATYVPERVLQAAPMPVRTYLMHQARVQGLTRADLAAAVGRVLDEHDLGPVADRPVRELSKGWLQRTVLAQALVARPALVLLDEPWTGIDTRSHDHLTGVIDRARRRGVALLMTSHEPTRLTGVRRVRLVAGHLVDEPPPVSEPTPGPGTPRPVGRLRVVLLARPTGPPAADPDASLLDPVACVSHRVTPDGLELVIADDQADELLARALAGGWSVRRVVPRDPT